MPEAGGIDDRLQIALRRAERVEAEADAALQWVAWAEVEQERARAERDAARAERDTARAGLQAQLAALEEFQSSVSWRITAPVRNFAVRHPRVYRLLHRLRAGPLPAPAEGQPAAPPAEAPVIEAPAIVDQPPPLNLVAVRDDLPESPAALRISPLPYRAERVDIIICVHNALAVFRDCIASVLRHTHSPFRVIVVDDGSEAETAHFIDHVVAEHGLHLIRNPTASGYTRAANAGLRASDAPWIVFLNSDTMVTPGWLDRMWSHAARRPEVGVIGPLSNTASWQSVPMLLADGDWAQNRLPPGLGPDDIAAIVTRVARGAVRLPFLNGFCYMVRRALIDEIGPFDEATFGAGYGEENDFSIRARNAGWALVVATDAYVYHAQSQSYSTERRLKLAEAGNEALQRKHDPSLHIIPQVGYCRDNLPMHSVRARVDAGIRRRDLIAEGRERWAGKRVAFLKRDQETSDGLRESEVLAPMGVTANVLTFNSSSDAEAQKFRLSSALDQYDAIVATFPESVYWLPRDNHSNCRLAYYVGNFEEAVLGSYTYSSQIKLLARNSWVQREILRRTGGYAALLGPSLDVDCFTSAEDRALAGANAPVRISAMLTPASLEAGAARIVRVLERFIPKSQINIHVDVFGASDAELAEHGLSRPWIINRGVLEQDDLARLLAVSHVFADFSDYQPKGLISLAAMRSGCVVIGPAQGAMGEFVRHGQNGILLDTTDEQACRAELAKLIENAVLRTPLQINAIHDAHRFTPERVAVRLLRALFH
jgi:GT2 family glycosyltransferase